MCTSLACRSGAGRTFPIQRTEAFGNTIPPRSSNQSARTTGNSSFCIGRSAATSSIGNRGKAGATKVIDRLAADLKREFPDMKGFSPRNLKYMRRFAEVWAEEEFVQQVAAQLPWFHNCVLLDKVSDRDERIWYARAAIHHGWSRAVLVHQIESDLHRRQGKAITNFNRIGRAHV